MASAFFALRFCKTWFCSIWKPGWWWSFNGLSSACSNLCGGWTGLSACTRRQTQTKRAQQTRFGNTVLEIAQRFPGALRSLIKKFLQCCANIPSRSIVLLDSIYDVRIAPSMSVHCTEPTSLHPLANEAECKHVLPGNGWPSPPALHCPHPCGVNCWFCRPGAIYNPTHWTSVIVQ